MAITVKLRKKVISENRTSLYLDFYPAVINEKTGKKTRRQFLKLFLNNDTAYREQRYLDTNGKEQRRFIPILNKQGNPKKINLSPIDKKHNEETLKLAEQIRQKQDNQYNKPEIYTGYEKEQLRLKGLGERSFTKYFKDQVNKRNSRDNWLSAYKHFMAFAKKDIRFSDLTPQFCNEYREYMLNAKSFKKGKKPLSNNTRSSYFSKFKEALKQSFKDEILMTNLNDKIETIKPMDTEMGFLTDEEVMILAKTPCPNDILRKATFFSITTGLAFAEMEKLKWSEVRHSEDGYFVAYRRKKTGSFSYLPISETAYKILGNPKDADEKVFPGLCNRDRYYLFPKWIKTAGIKVKIKFHGLRHTYAVLQVEKGTDIFVLSKLLDHKDVKATQVYAKVGSTPKRKAADKMNFDLE